MKNKSIEIKALILQIILTLIFMIINNYDGIILSAISASIISLILSIKSKKRNKYLFPIGILLSSLLFIINNIPVVLNRPEEMLDIMMLNMCGSLIFIFMGDLLTLRPIKKNFDLIAINANILTILFAVTSIIKSNSPVLLDIYRYSYINRIKYALIPALIINVLATITQKDKYKYMYLIFSIICLIGLYVVLH